ncbi:Leucine-rich repeat [Sesbania bispinosa]|nr:Leucine-rich repeat [Sesbania bispinosa]
MVVLVKGKRINAAQGSKNGGIMTVTKSECTVVRVSDGSAPKQCHEDESHALLQFKKGFVISKFASYNPLSYPKTASWNGSTDCCSWDGIECDEQRGHVIGVDLSSSHLFGSMDANTTLFHLPHLQRLNLADNDFNYSQIPSTIDELSKLRYLNLSQTKISGEIPHQVSHLSKLLSLDLSISTVNVYAYPFPIKLLRLKTSTLRSLIQNSTSLEILRLRYVTISSYVPVILTNLTSLQTLYLYHCDLYGEFPAGIFHLPNLKQIDVGYNQDLTGNIPDFHSSPPISLLQLAGTSFYGTLPASIGKLKSLIAQVSIPSSLGNLTQLKYLGLRYNKFKGRLSSDLANLTKLHFLDVGFNEFSIESETISWICKLSEINALGLTNIGSKIPSCFVNLTQLSALDIPNSNLSGEIPSWIMNLTNLAFLDLGGNNLKGEILDSLFQLENLELLELDSNLLQGELELHKFLKPRKLIYVDLSYNNISLVSGKNSSNATLSRIQVLGLSSCNLVEFPEFFQDLGEVTHLDLSDNSVNSFPSWIWRKTSLRRLSISHNSLRGKISPSICNLEFLEHLDLSYNSLSGTIPSCLGSFSQSLQILMLQGNKLSGLIPQTYMITSSLKMIDLRNNSLQGQLPRALVNCRMLEVLDVSHNQINDSFPFWLGALPELKVIALRNNQFYGSIGCPITCSFPKLHIIDLSHNEFSGCLSAEIIQNLNSMKASNMDHLQYEQNWTPRKLGRYNWNVSYSYSFTMSNKGLVMVYKSLQQFYNLIAIDLSSNRISGEIPDVMGDLNGLVLLNLSNNMLTGSIPSSLGKLSNLEALDLSLNSLSGNIPQQLTQITFLEFFNVSFNNLSGPIPQNKQFSTFEGNSFEGNKGLCGNQLLKKCVDDAGPSFVPPSASDGDQDTGSFLEFDWKIVLIGYGGGIVAGVALGSTFSPQILGWLRKKGILG